MKINNYSFNKNQQYEIKNAYDNYGFVIIKQFFSIKNIKSNNKEIPKLLKKKDINFYFENIKKKKILKRIERVADF